MIGDTVLSTGVINYLQKKYPHASFTFVIGPNAKPLLKNFNNIDKIISIKKKKYNFHWIEILFFNFKNNWDIVIDLKSSILSFFLKSKKKYIFKKKSDVHHIEQLSETFNFDCSNLIIPTSKDEEKIANSSIDNKFKHIVVFPGGNWKPKIWDTENFNFIIKKINTKYKYVKFILVGSKEEEKMYYEIISKNIPQTNIINLFGMTLTQTAAFMKKSDLFIGNDSGLMHLATACQIKTIALFGPTNDKIYSPWGRKNVVLRTKEDFNYFKNRNKLNKNISYMGSINVKEVYDLIINSNIINAR